MPILFISTRAPCRSRRATAVKAIIEAPGLRYEPATKAKTSSVLCKRSQNGETQQDAESWISSVTAGGVHPAFFRS